MPRSTVVYDTRRQRGRVALTSIHRGDSSLYNYCRYVFQTDTKYTLCMSGTGHAGMEATVANLVEPGETVVVGNKGDSPLHAYQATPLSCRRLRTCSVCTGQGQSLMHAGIWGMRVADLASRYGANVVEMTTGGEARSFSLDEIRTAVETHKPALLFLCQGESSMGALATKLAHLRW